MEGLIERLRRFNRKERFYLIGRALGNQAFTLSEEFRQTLGKELALDIPRDAFVAMDYHLNWLYAALLLATAEAGRAIPHDLEPSIAGNQEDIDLLIAYDEDRITRAVLVEAKGATGWTNKQLMSKASRLKTIFDEDGNRWDTVQPRFVIASPRRPRLLNDTGWPSWMKNPVRWIELRMPPDVQRITRCDAEGLIGETGTHWKIVSAALGVSPDVATV